MTQPIHIIGAGGLGRELAAAIRNDDRFDLIGFYDDDPSKEAPLTENILGTLDDIQTQTPIIIGIGMIPLKKQVSEKLQGKNIDWLSFIHTHAHLESIETIHVGKGSMICSGVQMTTDIRIGKHVLVNLNCTIGHDAEIGDFSSLMPGAHISGNVKLGSGVLVGSGATILPNLTIGDDVIIGAGAVVTHDVPSNQTVVGVPATQR